MSEVIHRAIPMSRADIRVVATELRRMTGTLELPWFPVVDALELVLDQIAPGFDYDIRTCEEMGENHGLTDFQRKLIILREDVYEGACDGNGRDRGTVAHEIGHAILHSPDRLARTLNSQVVKAYEDPEWQAKAFAGELLMYHRLVGQFSSASEAAREFGVSLESAELQWDVWRRSGLITA